MSKQCSSWRQMRMKIFREYSQRTGHELEHAALNYAKQVHSHEAIARQLETKLEELTTRKRIKNKER